MEKKKKKWLQPELTVLVRRNPEEGILAACKYSGVGSSSDNSYVNCLVFNCGIYCTDWLAS